MLYSLRLQLSQAQYREDYKDFEGFASYKISIWLLIQKINNIQRVPKTLSVSQLRHRGQLSVVSLSHFCVAQTSSLYSALAYIPVISVNSAKLCLN